MLKTSTTPNSEYCSRRINFRQILSPRNQKNILVLKYLIVKKDTEIPRIVSRVRANAAILLLLLVIGQPAAANSLRIVAGPGIVTAVLAAIFFCNPRS